VGVVASAAAAASLAGPGPDCPLSASQQKAAAAAPNRRSALTEGAPEVSVRTPEVSRARVARNATLGSKNERKRISRPTPQKPEKAPSANAQEASEEAIAVAKPYSAKRRGRDPFTS
jgi:hypothetical protein